MWSIGFRAIPVWWFNYVFVLPLFVGCTEPELQYVNNLNNNQIGVIGHGGSGFQSVNNPLPHNSYTSIARAVKAYNADGVEVDVQLSADGVLVLYHDDMLQSVTNCQGCIHAWPSQKLKDCQYRMATNMAFFMNEKVVMLDTILSELNKRKQKPYVFLDVRTHISCANSVEELQKYQSRLAQAIAAIISKYQGQDWIKVEVPDLHFLHQLKQKDPHLCLSLDAPNAQVAIHQAAKSKLNGIVIANNNITKQQIAEAHQKGLQVSLYEVKGRRAHIEAVNKSPDFIQTDNLGLLIEVLAALPQAKQ